jgi:hypothetical protein
MYYIYAVSVHIESSVEKEWLDWMIKQHIPDVLKTGCFVSSKIFKVEQEDANQIVYSIQYKYKNKEDFEKYEREFAQKLRNEHNNLFGKYTLAFRSHSRIIHEFSKPQD